MKELDGVIVVIGQNVWGIGKTLTEAKKNAYSPTKYIAYFAPKGTQVEAIDGDLSVPVGTFRPQVIERKGIKAPEGKA